MSLVEALSVTVAPLSRIRVVVGSDTESLQPILHGISGGEHDDPGVHSAAYPLCQRRSRASRQHPVQDHEVGPECVKHGVNLVAIVDGGDPESCLLQRPGDGIADCLIVLHEKDTSGIRHSSLSTGEAEESLKNAS